MPKKMDCQEWILVVGLDDEEDDRRDDGDIGERTGGVVRETALRAWL
jgi:hypothetical protein